LRLSVRRPLREYRDLLFLLGLGCLRLDLLK